MSIRRAHLAENNAEPDMTPMLDIVFILLIFFIVTTSFVKEAGILVGRPAMNSSQNESPPAMVFKINDVGMVTFNGQAVDIERVPARIENFMATNESTTAIVIPTETTRYEDVVNVLDKIKAFEQLTISIGK